MLWPEEILAASERLESSDRLSVLCRAGGCSIRTGALRRSPKRESGFRVGRSAHVPQRSRFKMACFVLDGAKLTRPTITRYIKQLSERCSARVVPQRSKMTDSEVRRHIQRGTASRSSLSQRAFESASRKGIRGRAVPFRETLQRSCGDDQCRIKDVLSSAERSGLSRVRIIRFSGSAAHRFRNIGSSRYIATVAWRRR